VISVVILIVGLFFVSQTLIFLNSCLETNGVVVDIHWRTSTSGGQTKLNAHPVIQFVDKRTGNTYNFTGVNGSNPPAYSIGQEVEILYDPKNPTQATVKSFFDIWGLSIVLMAMGSFLLSCGLINIGVGIHRRRKFPS